MVKDFKKWWKETHNRKDLEVIHATQKSLDEYMRAHPHHQVVKDVIFEEEITLTGNHERLDIERVCFLHGLKVEDFSSFHDLSFKTIAIAEKFSAKNVSLTRNLVLNQDIGEILTTGITVHISNCHIRGKIVFQK
jgi:hypothetical protein